MKYKKVEYDIPMYFGKLVIVQDKDGKRIAKEYGIDDVEKMAGCCFREEKKSGRTNYVMTIFGKTTPSIIAHEAVHVVNQIFMDRYIKLDLYNDEPQAYLLGWVVEQCHKTLKLQ